MQDIPLRSLANRLGIRKLSRMRGMALAVLALLVIGVYSRIAITHQYDWMCSPDVVHQVFPWLEVQADAWQKWQLPLWDPYIWGGQPLLGQVQPGASYPLNWLLFLLPQREGMIRYGFLDWYFVALRIMAAWFAYLLARGLGASRVASVAGGLIFGLGGYLGRSDWPQMSNSALWAPLVLLAILRAPRSARSLSVAALGGVALGISFLSGHHQVPIFVSITSGILWVIQSLRGGVIRMKMVQAAAVFFIVAGLISALQVLPSVEYGKAAVRWVGMDMPAKWKDTIPYHMHDGLAIEPYRLPGIVIPNNYNQYDHFLGMAGLTLACIGVAAGLRRWPVRIFAVLGVASIWIAMGGLTALHGLMYALIPMMEKARTPAAFNALFSVSASVLAAFGVDALRRRRAETAARLGARTLSIVGGSLIAFGAGVFLVKGATYPNGNEFFASALFALLLAAAIVAWRANRIPRAWFSGAVLALLVLELSVSALLPYPHKMDRNRKGAYQERFSYLDIAEYLRKLPDHQRAHINGEQIPIMFGDLYHIPVFDGYTVSIPTTVWELGIHSRRSMQLYGISRYVSRDPLYPEQVPVAEFSNGFKAWDMPDAFPRTWFAHEARSFDSADSFRGAFEAGEFLDRRVAPFVGNAPALSGCTDEQRNADQSSITTYAMNYVAMRASSACGGLLIVSDNVFPGWKAYVDGRPVEIHQPYLTLRGILLEPGEHTIEMRYRPTSVIAGAALTGLGVLLVIGILAFDHSRRRREQSGEPKALLAS